MAAQDAELKLKVSLDLAFFRQQLNGLGTVAAGVPITIPIKFDRRSVQNELNALGANIRRRTYRLNVETNLKTEIGNAETLAKALADLDRASKKVGGVSNRMAPSGLAGAIIDEQTSYKQLQALYKFAREANLPFEQLARGAASSVAELRRVLGAGFGEVGDEVKNGISDALKDATSTLAQLGKEMGETLLKETKGSLGIASPSREFKKIGQNVGEGFQQGMLSSMDKAFDAVEGLMKARMRVLDTLARGMFRMAGIDPAAIKAEAAQRRALPGINFAATVPPRNISIGPSSTGRALPSGGLPNTAGALPPAYRGLPFGFDYSGAPQGKASADVSGGLVSLESGFISQMTARYSRIAERFLFGVETQVVDLFDSTQQAVNSAVDQYIANIQSKLLQEARRNVSVKDLGSVGQKILSPGGTGRAPLMLPAAGGTTPPSQMRFNAVTSAGGSGGGRGGGYVPPGGFPSDSPMGGKQGQATFIGAGSSMEKFKTGLDVASASMKNFRASQLPLVGGLKELTSEFGFAIKQVLLFGTAYKGLAFIQSLPGQILNAAKSQQQYNNALQTATQDTGTFAKELLYVDNVQRAFGLNLQTTREGFTKLYASMAPTGFDSGSIEKLFTGISAATAALQLTPDKAERVIYAFGQMASKGQIMSEELKGQLGDVLPGALAIFAKSAGMSVKEFSKAMEDGEFVGQKFRETFAKVSDELVNRFGTGAQAAGRSLQGLLNTVQGDFARTLESFAPLADSVAQSILGPLTGSLSQLSKAAQIAMGETERLDKQIKETEQDISDLKVTPGIDEKEIKAAEKNLLSLKIRQEELNRAYEDPAIQQQVSNIQSFVAEIGKAITFVQNFGSLLQGILGPAFNFLGGNITGVIGSLISLTAGFAATRLAVVGVLGVLNTLNTVEKITRNGAVGAQLLATAFKVVGVQITGAQVATIGFGVAIKGLLASTGIGLLVVALTSAATAFMTLGDKAAEAARKSKQAIESMTQAAASGNVALLDMEIATAKAELGDLGRAQKIIGSLQGARRQTRGGGSVTEIRAEDISPGQRAFLEQQGITVPTRGTVNRSALTQQLGPLRASAAQRQQAAEAKRPFAVERQAALGLNVPSPTVPTGAEDLDAKDTKGAAVQSLESLESLRDQLAKARMEGDMERAKILFEYQKRLDERRFELQESGANDIQKAGIKLAKDLFDVKMRLEEQIFNAGQSIAKEAGSVAPGNRPPRAPKGQLPYKTAASTQYGSGADQNTMIGQTVGALPGERPVSGSERRDIVAAEKTVQATKTASLQTTLALKNAEADYAQVIKQNFDTLFPVAQLQLQNQLLAARYQLELQAVPQEAIDAQLAITEARAKGVELQKVLDKELADSIKTFDKYTAIQKEGIELTQDQAKELKIAEIAINTYSKTVGKAADQVKQFTIAQLENAVAALEQADALKALEETAARINQAVEGVSGTYKDLFKELIKGGDSTEALKKAQEALADQTLTLFLDFAMQPVEKFFKDQLGAIFGVPSEEAQREKSIAVMKEQIKELQEQKKIQQGIKDNTDVIVGAAPGTQQTAEIPSAETPSAIVQGVDVPIDQMPEGMQLPDVSESAEAYKENLSSVNETIKSKAEEAGPNGEAGKQLQKALGATVQGIGLAAGSILGIAAGINQIKEGGASNVLGGIATVVGVVGSLIGGISGIAGALNKGAAPAAPTKASARGSYFNSGMSYFATGGIVSSPSFFQFADGGKINMGMMGEAGPEAIMPLKRGADGKLGVQVADNRAALNAASNAAAEGSSDAFGDENEMDAAGRAAIREIERIKENKNSLTSNSERSIMKQMLDSERDRISESRSEVNSQQLTSEISLMRERMLENRMQLESQRSAVERSYETERLRENRMELMSQQYESERRFERERIEKMASTSQKLDINYTSQVINNVEYVTREQAEQLAAQSALRGRELALGSLQNSVKARKRVGIA